MLFEVDLVLCDANQEQPETKLKTLREKMESVDLKLSMSKTEYLTPVREDGNIWMKKYKSTKMKLCIDVRNSCTMAVAPPSTRKGSVANRLNCKYLRHGINGGS